MSRHIPRRFLLGGAAAALPLPGILTARGDSPEFQMRLGSNKALNHPNSIRQKEAADRILNDTNGRVKITVYPDNQIGSDTAMLGQLRAGTLDFMTLSGLILATTTPVTSIYGVGYAFSNYAAVWAAMDGGLGRMMSTAVERIGLHVFEKVWDNGFRQISSSTRPIRTPADLKGFKIRVPIGPMFTSMFLSLEAEPLSLNYAEIYEALKTGVVDGQENPLVNIDTGKMYEVQKYVSMTRHMWDGFLMLGNNKTWMSLPEDVRDVIAKNLNGSGEDQRLDVANSENAVRKKLQQVGMTFNEPDPEPFRKMLIDAGFYDAWKTKFGREAWDMLEKYTGKIGS